MPFIIKYWRLFAALGAVIAIIYSANYLVNTGRDKEKVKIAKEIQKDVSEAKQIQDRNRRSSDDDITKRLYRWQRD